MKAYQVTETFRKTSIETGEDLGCFNMRQFFTSMKKAKRHIEIGAYVHGLTLADMSRGGEPLFIPSEGERLFESEGRSFKFIAYSIEKINIK